jgi:hypothetical protein
LGIVESRLRRDKKALALEGWLLYFSKKSWKKVYARYD